jgi:hypothetical protein
LLAPLLLLLRLDLAEKVASGADLVADRKGTCLPCVRNDQEFGVELR